MSYQRLPWAWAAALLPLPFVAQSLLIRLDPHGEGHVGVLMCGLTALVMALLTLRIWQRADGPPGRRVGRTVVRSLVAWTVLSGLLAIGAATTVLLTDSPQLVGAATAPAAFPPLTVLALVVLVVLVFTFVVVLALPGAGLLALLYAVLPGRLFTAVERRWPWRSPTPSSSDDPPDGSPDTPAPAAGASAERDPSLRSRLALGGVGLVLLGLAARLALGAADPLLNILNHTGCSSQGRRPKITANCFATSGAPLQEISDLAWWTMGTGAALLLGALLVPVLVARLTAHHRARPSS